MWCCYVSVVMAGIIGGIAVVVRGGFGVVVAYIQDSFRRAVTDEGQLEVGAVYRIVGTCDGSLDVPTQLVRIESLPRKRSVVGISYVEVLFFANLGSLGKVSHRNLMFLDTVNIPEHGMHDRHLERLPDHLAEAAGLLATEQRKQDYGEMVGPGEVVV